MKIHRNIKELFMADNLVQLQHVSKGPAAFTHGHIAVESDEDGFISIPSEMSVHAKAHGFSAVPHVVKSLKPLAKAAKGDDSTSDGADKVTDAEPVKAKGAKAAKGGEQ